MTVHFSTVYGTDDTFCMKFEEMLCIIKIFVLLLCEMTCGSSCVEWLVTVGPAKLLSHLRVVFSMLSIIWSVRCGGVM